MHGISQISSASQTGIDPRTELDSHANMVVLGKNCFIFDNVHGRTCNVEPFDKNLGTARQIPVVDAALAYDCPYSHETYLLIIRNALYIESMENNLIPPFIMREAGLLVRDTPKIHLEDPNAQDHAITFHNNNLSIPLQLHGTFSFFHTRKPTCDEVKYTEPIFLTPDSDNWDPYSEHFRQNEESMTDWEGNMAPKRHRNVHTLDLDVAVETSTYEDAVDHATISAFQALTLGCNEAELIRHEGREFAEAMSVRAEHSKFAIGMGSTSQYDNCHSSLFEPVYHHVDEFKALIDSAQASKPHSVSPDFISKIWNIKPDLAQKAINQTTQLYRKGADNDLSRQFSTNDCMLVINKSTVSSSLILSSLLVKGSPLVAIPVHNCSLVIKALCRYIQ